MKEVFLLRKKTAFTQASLFTFGLLSYVTILEAVHIQTFLYIMLSIDILKYKHIYTSYPIQTLQLYLVGSQGFNVIESSEGVIALISRFRLIFGF